MIQTNIGMTPEQFAYWLQGYTEICGETPTPEQWQVIKDHIKEVFRKVTPEYTTTTTYDKNILNVPYYPNPSSPLKNEDTFIC